MQTESTADLAHDLCEGAEAIALFMYGTEKARRKVYYQIERGYLPVFRLGQSLCARKSTLRQWIAEQERAGLGA